MHQDIVIPEVGESVREAVLAEWFVKTGERVTKGTVLFVLETDKVTLEVPAEADGVVEILVPAGETVSVGAVVGRIQVESAAEAPAPEPRERPPVSEVPRDFSDARTTPVLSREDVPKAPAPPFEPAAAVAVSKRPEETAESPSAPRAFSSAMKLAAELGVNLADVKGTGPDGRITRGDVLLFWESRVPAKPPLPEEFPAAPGGAEPLAKADKAPPAPPAGRTSAGVGPASRAGAELGAAALAPGAEAVSEETRKPMSPIRKRIAERLLQAKHSTAMLTTFNEVDMGRVMEFRRRFKDAFKEKYGVSLGFMSFFVKACVQALQEIPEVNAFIEGEDMVYHAHVHMGIAIGAERGLVVPVIRYADRLGFAEIEKAIDDFVRKIRENRLKLSDLEGGTFTISNGGVYGSLLSTPILNPPQSAILGLHKIEDRPIAQGGQVVVRPMMYVALSYDHRIIDGREAVTFLRRIKECIEDPERLLVGI
ncbi:MAG: 2-oxoglutarate dehydrogenase complex dihydrolipoyllysine-residue succinyltransferase [Desulfosoma sp.]